VARGDPAGAGSGAGAALRRLREARGMSQTELARQANLSRSYLCRIESGEKPLTSAVAGACDAVLGSDLSGLVGRQPPGPVPPGLPPVTGLIVGRDKEIAHLAAVLCTDREDAPGAVTVCAVAGLGGIGKTTLALRVAHLVKGSFPDGCLFIDLHGYDGEGAVTPADALYRLLIQAGADPGSIPAHLDDRSTQLRGLLSERRCLLLLDNARDVQQVGPLIPSGAGCRTLVTSRDALTGLDTTERLVLGGLDPDDSVWLLRSLYPPRAFTEQELRLIAAWAGHLPLALRIAPSAFASTDMSTDAGTDAGTDVSTGAGTDVGAGTGGDALRRRLGTEADRLDDFQSGDRSLAAVFEGSLRNLAPPLRGLFLLLGLHPGAEFSLPTAAALADEPPARTRRNLRRLCDLSLLTPLNGERYKFHDLVRLFAADRATAELAPGVRTAAVTRAVDRYLLSMAAADRVLAPDRFMPALPPEQGLTLSLPTGYDEALSWAVTEQDNLVAAGEAAFEHGLDDRCWTLAHVLRGYFFLTKPWDQWVATHETAARAASRAGDRQGEAITLNNLGLAYIGQGDHERAGALYLRARDLFAAVGDAHGVHTSLAHHAWVHFDRGDHEQALEQSLRVLEFRRAAGDTRKTAILLRDIAHIEIALGRHDHAVAHLREALPVFAALDSRIDTAMTHNCLGEAYLRLGRPDDAEPALRRAAEASRVSGSDHERARALENLATVAATRGDPAEARSHRTEALELYRRLNDGRALERVRGALDRRDPAEASDARPL
jgi:tetratricopeptide (TPR) repeat protein/transcriptional regulator with XRE-family HTH domain